MCRLLLLKVNKKDTSQHYRKFYIKTKNNKIEDSIKLCWKSGRVIKTEKEIDIKDIYDMRYNDTENKISIWYRKNYYNYSNLTIIMPNKEQMYIMISVLCYLTNYCKNI